MAKNVVSVVKVDGGFAVAVDKVPTGQVYPLEQSAKDEVKNIKEARKAATLDTKEE